MSKIKTVEILQISAGLAAALRWAIALMPLDGLPFALSSRPWFEPVSFFLSLTFAAVEIGATAYIMRAWRMEPDKHTQRGLMWLWIVALVLMVAAQVPPILANINGVAVTKYPFWFQSLWAVCGVAVTFVVIGGVGYAEKSLINAPHDEIDQIELDYKPVILTPHDIDQEPHSEPQAPLTDHLVRLMWTSKRAKAPYAEIEADVKQALNGTSAAFADWYANGKQSMAALASVLGVTDNDRGRFEAVCRGLLSPNGREIGRKDKSE